LSTSSEAKRYRATARAKVNLALEVLRRRGDGYHEIETIFQTISLADELEMSFNRTSEVRISCNDPDIPADDRNLCARAIEVMRDHAGRDLGAVIRIDKKIPQCAGLGGGSADAAAVILAVNRAEGLDLPQDALDRAALECGSDVPFMLRGGTMLGRGRGEELTRLTPIQRGVFVIVKPPVDISTAWVYKNVNFQLTRHRYRFNLKAVNAILARFPNVGISLRNALEDVVCPSYPSVSEVLEELLSSRPFMASMSGSGSALFAVVENENKASRLAERFAVRGFFTAVAVPCARAVDLYPVEAR
jgi:4-diphosphocytidyl-2-C-methyl-D-erythritol kinase